MQHDTSQDSASLYAAERRAATEHGARVTAACALALIPVFAYLDTLLFAEHATRFVEWRLASWLVVLAVFALSFTKLGRRWPLLLGVIVPLAIGADVNLVTLVAGREANPYYSGLIVILLGVSLLLPWTPGAAFAVSVFLVGGYAAGMLATGPIADVPLFTSNLFLVGGSAVLVVVGAAVNERLRRREFESRRALHAHARRQEAVARLGQLALGGTEPRALMERTTALIAETLDFELAAVLEMQGDGKALVLRSGTGWKSGLVGRATIALEPRSQARHTLGVDVPVFSDDLGAESRFTPMPLLEQHHAVSGISVAIAGHEGPFGILLAYTARPRMCSLPELEFLESLAGVLTTAILRERADFALAAEAHASTALARVGRELISSLDTPVLLERVCERTAEALGTDHSVTWLLDAQAQVYHPISAHGLPADKWEALRILRLPASAIASIVSHLEQDELVQITPESHEYPLAGGILSHLGITRSLLIPLRRGGKVVGVQANGYRGRTEPFTRQQEQLGRSIGQLASMALSNARLVEELERASRLKSEFVSTMSHELRTPLNVILGYLDMLGDELGPGAHDSLLTRVRASGLELLEMIDATLNLNRIAAGQDPPQLAEVRVEELWHELRGEFAALPRKTTAALRWEAAGDISLRTDRRKLKIVVKNLVANALKFTPSGEVVVQCAEQDGTCLVTVSDTGIGISATHLPHIFDMFRQVDSSDARSYAGAGLGLYIVKSLLTQLGGEVTVESRLARGSTFRVRLPLVANEVSRTGASDASTTDAPASEASMAAWDARDGSPSDDAADAGSAERRLLDVAARSTEAQRLAATAAATAATAPRRKRRIVFADDLEVNRHLLARLLAREMPDVECFEACDGMQALAMVEAHRPDLVLLDLRMPEMDGWQAARRIRELEGGRDVPIIALSVSASEGVEAYAIHAGCNEFVAKPVSDYSTLMGRINHWLGPKDGGSDGANEPGDTDLCILCRQPLPSAVLRAALQAQRP